MGWNMDARADEAVVRGASNVRRWGGAAALLFVAGCGGVLSPAPSSTAVPVARALRAVVHSVSPGRLTVKTPDILAELHTVIGSDLASGGRQLLAAILVGGMLLVATTMAGATSLRRRDFGRRRALGATRSALVLLVLVQAAIAATIGSILGSAIGLLAVWRLAGSLPPVEFVAAVGALSVLMALAAAVPPGILAARRDPVRILRVP